MKNKVFNYIKILMLIILVWYLTRYLLNNVEQLKKLDFRINLSRFLLASMFFILYKITQSFLWHYITIKNKANIGFHKAITYYLYSQLGKYLPGKLFLLGGRLYFYHKEGVSTKKTTFCFFIENLCTLLGATFLFIGSIPFVEIPAFKEYKYLGMILIIVFVILIHPKVLQKAINIPLKILKREEIFLQVKYKDMLKFVILFILNWIIVGIGFYILVDSIYPIGIENIFFVSGTFGLAVVIGILSLFSPSGIGVREGIIVFALQFIMPSTAAVVVSIVSRLWATLGELLLVGATFIYMKFKQEALNDIREPNN